MTSSELDSRNIALSMRKSVENLVISSQDAIGQSISQALTFSGVITHHNNQILHENRNISRSPSPSLRITDPANETIENDKGCEAFYQAADTVSISSSELPSKTDNQKSTSNPSSKSSDGAVRGKKKSWYNSLYPTYKSKSDDFKRLFKDLPDDERLIVDYSCALQKDILAHGRLYASQNYLCFYANIFGWETSLTLKWKEVTAITKEKTALVIPNAILVCTEGEKNFLTSFSGRDKAYLMLFRIWQNALMDQPITTHEIWQWVHSCYGEELGFASDDDEYSRDFADDAPGLPQDISEEVGESCVDAAGGEPREEHRTSRPASHTRDISPPLVSNGDGVVGTEEAADTLPTDMSDSSDSELDNKNNVGAGEKCSEPHDGRLFLKQTFSFNIDQLFTMIFTNSKFSLELLAARNITDYVQSPWQAQKGLKCRQTSYKLGLTSGPIGPKEVHVTETQVMNNCSAPGCLYSIDSTSDNAGIPYADHFSVCVHYCMVRITDQSTELHIYGQVKYKKPMWGMMKTFLEKNSMSGLEEFSRLLEARLLAEADTAVPAARKSRRHRRLIPTTPSTAALPTATPLTSAGSSPGSTTSSGRWLALIIIVLLAINGLLYWKLYHGPQPGFHVHDLEDRLNGARVAEAEQWRRLLEQHSAQAQTQLQTWRHSLHSSTQLLQQTEEALTKLLEAIQPALDAARAHPAPAPAPPPPRPRDDL